MSNMGKALALAALGLAVFPVNEMKRPLIDRGFRAASSAPALVRDRWTTHPDALVGVATGAPSGFWALDIDVKGGKDGFASLAAAGILPAETLTYETPSGGRHFLFRADAMPGIGANVNGMEGVDVRGTGGYVVWHGDVPEALELATWDRPSWAPVPGAIREAREVSTAELDAWIEANGGDMSPIVAAALARYLPNGEAELRGHTETVKRIYALAMLGFEGHEGAGSAIEALHIAWDASEHGRDPAGSSEWDLMVKWALGKVPGDLSAPYSDDRFWTSRPELEAIWRTAHRIMVAPWALFGGLALRALHSVPPSVTYRSMFGPASLNALAIMVGTSGGGKSLLNAQLDELFPMWSPGMTWRFAPEEVGSGEAIPELFARLERGKDDSGAATTRLVFHTPEHPAAQLSFDEVGRLASMNSRQGSTVLDYLKTAWSGGALGRRLANGGGFNLPAGSYRLTGAINAQPARSGVLVSQEEIAGGFTGRLLWFSTHDPRVVEHEDPAWPEPYRIELPEWSRHGITEVRATDEMNAYHREHKRAMALGQSDSLTGQEPMARVKVAVALMVLNGRHELNAEDWELSELVMEYSRGVRESVFEAQRKLSAESIDRRGKAEGRAAAVAALTEDEVNLEQTKERLLTLQREGKPLSSEHVTSRLRPYVGEAKAALGLA